MAPGPAHRRHPSRRPQGQATRGKTAQNRLRRVDLFLQWYAPEILRRSDGAWARAFFVDLGYGAEPFTTLETAARLRQLNPDLRLLGVEIDPDRVAIAQPYADRQTIFRRGGFNLPLMVDVDGQPEMVRCIRAFNVLRQYEEADVFAAYAAMADGVLPGGLLVEGTSDPTGRIWVANVLRRVAGRVAAGGIGFQHQLSRASIRRSFSPCCPRTTSTVCSRGANRGIHDGLETGCPADCGGAHLGAAALVSRQHPGLGGGRLAHRTAQAVDRPGFLDSAAAVPWLRVQRTTFPSVSEPCTFSH